MVNDQMNLGFQFKQFYARHDRCAMKVGTDGVLLGAWTPITNHQSPITDAPFHVLDIGTGCGLVALMIAQRFPDALIDAIDIDTNAVQQAAENFAVSPWHDRLHACLSSLQEWQTHNIPSLEGRVRERFYNLIVSNPPYFQNSLKNPDESRKTARHTDTLTYDELIRHSVRLLADNGTLSLILPAESEETIRALAAQHGLSLARATRVYSKESKPVRRVLLAFEKSASRQNDISNYRNSPPFETRLVIEDDKGGRSAAYQELTKDFYL